jgi:hypothetical protein
LNEIAIEMRPTSDICFFPTFVSSASSLSNFSRQFPPSTFAFIDIPLTVGFRSKFRKVFPFGFSLKDKQKDGKNHNGFVNVSENKSDEKFNGDIVNYLTAAALCVGGGPAITASNKQIIKSFCRPLEVPK